METEPFTSKGESKYFLKKLSEVKDFTVDEKDNEKIIIRDTNRVVIDEILDSLYAKYYSLNKNGKQEKAEEYKKTADNLEDTDFKGKEPPCIIKIPLETSSYNILNNSDDFSNLVDNESRKKLIEWSHSLNLVMEVKITEDYSIEIKDIYTEE